jgi:uncharacterized protein YndB with AHSA1/START domain
MNTLHLSTVISASKEKVWRTMLDQENFRAWTGAFAVGFDYEGSWDKGARIRSLTPDGSSMSSIIAGIGDG